MTRYTTTSSRPHESVLPRAQSGFTRHDIHGDLIGMDDAQDAICAVCSKVWRVMLACVAVGAGIGAGHFISIALFGFERINLW